MKSAFFIGMVLVLATLAAAPLPPSFEYQQFQGTVVWDASLLVTPQNVIARTPTKEFRSFLRHDSCSSMAVECSGTFGKEVSNYLRVRAAAGESIQLYVDSTLVMTVPYQPDQVTELLLNVSSPKAASLAPSAGSSNASSGSSSPQNTSTKGTASANSCVSDWRCGGWSACVAGQQARSCVDAQQCTATALTKEETQACTSGSPASPPSSGQQGTPLPVQEPSVPPVSPPAEVQQPAAETCSDGLKNQQEVGIDCGGACAACPAEEGSEEVSLLWYVIGIVGLLLLIGCGTFYALRLRNVSISPIQDQQLLRYFQTNFARGLNKSQITETLTRSGWNKGVIQSFLKKRKL